MQSSVAIRPVGDRWVNKDNQGFPGIREEGNFPGVSVSGCALKPYVCVLTLVRGLRMHVRSDADI
jgi:hypothetical protein